VARIVLPAGYKSSEEVLVEAFKALGCERWGGASENGWSKISDLLRCPYRYYLRHVKGLTSSAISGEASAPMEIGSYGHVVLAAYYAGMLPDDRYPGFRDNCPTPDEVLAALDAAGADPMSLAEARTTWEGYIDHWGDDGLAPMAVEVPSGDVRLHTCRYDLIADVADGMHDGIWAIDHKFLTPKANVDLYQLDGEIIGEALCWEVSKLDEIYGPLAGVCVNILFKGKPPRGLSPYLRRWFPLDEALVASFGRDRMFWQAQVNTFTKMGHFPRSHFGCVSRYFDTCLFWDHCSTLSDASLMLRKP